MEQNITIDKAHQNYEAIVAAKQNINIGFWALVTELRECRDKKYWEVLGYHSWASYLAQPEIDLSVHTVDNYLTIYNKVTELDLLPQCGSDIDIGKLSIITPKLTKENADELMDKAKSLSRSDLKTEITGIEKEIQPKCICPNCGNRHNLTNK